MNGSPEPAGRAAARSSGDVQHLAQGGLLYDLLRGISPQLWLSPFSRASAHFLWPSRLGLVSLQALIPWAGELTSAQFSLRLPSGLMASLRWADLGKKA